MMVNAAVWCVGVIGAAIVLNVLIRIVMRNIEHGAALVKEGILIDHDPVTSQDLQRICQTYGSAATTPWVVPSDCCPINAQVMEILSRFEGIRFGICSVAIARSVVRSWEDSREYVIIGEQADGSLLLVRRVVEDSSVYLVPVEDYSGSPERRWSSVHTLLTASEQEYLNYTHRAPNSEHSASSALREG